MVRTTARTCPNASREVSSWLFVIPCISTPRRSTWPSHAAETRHEALWPHAVVPGRGEPAAPAGGDLAPGAAGDTADPVAGADGAAGLVGPDHGPADAAIGNVQGLDGDPDAGDVDGAVTTNHQ